jgi:hypothetical protein
MSVVFPTPVGPEKRTTPWRSYSIHRSVTSSVEMASRSIRSTGVMVSVGQ